MEQRKIITSTPENSETPIADTRSWVTPNRLFFVRNHFDVPQLSKESWRLTIEGSVERPLEINWQQLESMPERSVFVTVECAGNGRSYLTPRPHGVPWGAGAIGHAEWTGVPLHLVLKETGVEPDAIEVVFEGADRGTEADHPEEMCFARSLPLAKALDPNTLLAMRMNGELLEANHGFPVRLLVPGWYGVASIKWLTRIVVSNEVFKGYYQTKKYTVKRPTPGGLATEVVGPMVVKSEIVRPHQGEVLGIGTNRLFGVAWAGPEAIARVEVSTDDGSAWNDAELIGPRSEYSWTMWEYLWEVASPGDYSLLARATSASGATQPVEHNPLDGGYRIHHYTRAREIRVEATRRVFDERSSPDLLVYDMNAFAEENYRFPLDVELEFSGGEGI